MKITLVARGLKELEGVAAEIRQAGGEVAMLPADLATGADCRRVFERSAG